MAISRPVLLALIGVLLAAVTFTASRNAREASDESSSSAAPAGHVAPTPRPAGPAEREAKAEPQRADRPAARAGAPRRPPRHAAGRSKRAALDRAVKRGRIVVLTFFHPGGGDDAATGKGVAALKGTRGVSLFRDSIKNVGRYGPVVRTVGVSQAPAIVLIDRNRRARLIEGYVDERTLLQEVADLRR